jgi:hypothetical protein
MAEFKTKLVKQIPVTPARQQAIWLGIAGVVVALTAIPITIIPATRYLSGYMFIIGVIIIIVAVIMVRGNFGGGAELVNDDILFTPDTIEVDHTTFPVSGVDDLRIVAHSFNKMRLPNNKNNRKEDVSNGMSNQVLFDYEGKKYKYHFYVNSARHMFILGELLTEWYKKKYFFIEYDAFGNRTYLFKERKGVELEAFKKKYGL